MDAPCHDLPHSPGHASLRRGRTSLPGQAYLLTTTTLGRAPIFDDFEVAATVAATFSDRGLWRDSRLLAWVLMPDHWHGLLELGSLDTLATALGRAKSVSARRASARRQDTGRMWSSAFHDRALRRGENVVAAARYVVANPVRAGLVRRIGDYPFWDAVWL